MDPNDDLLRTAVQGDAVRVVAEYARRAADPRLARYYARIQGALVSANAERRVRVRRLLLSLGRPSGVRVLDIGCGEAQDLADLVDAGWSRDNMVGVEIYAESLTRARLNLQGATFLEANAAALPFPAAAFDAVLQTTVLSSVLDDDVRKAIANEMWRVTRPGGLIISYDMDSAGSNPQLVGIGPRELDRLFADKGPYSAERITLPLAIASRVPGPAAQLLNRVTALRDHHLAWQRRT